MVTDRSDGALIAAVLAGDTDAFAGLVRRYQHVYYRFAVRMLGSHDDADDALQSAFVRAYRSLSSCRDPNRFAAWFYQIVLNECRTLAVSRQRRENRFVDIAGATEPAAVAGEAHEREELEHIQRVLDRLDPDQREAFVLRHVEELEYEEMSALTGASVSALKMRVKRARDRMKQLLEPARSIQ
jgi:RNA polymerase sigma-70 factor, ECF subfamily